MYRGLDKKLYGFDNCFYCISAFVESTAPVRLRKGWGGRHAGTFLRQNTLTRRFSERTKGVEKDAVL